MFIDLATSAEESQDPVLLRDILSALIGQRCVRVGMSYGSEFVFHLGESLPYSHPKLANQKRGSWMLSTLASQWRLLLGDPPSLIESAGFSSWLANFPDWPPPQIMAPPAQECQMTNEQIQQKAERLAGRTVTRIQPILFPLSGPVESGVGLAIDFGSGWSLVLVPNGEPEEDDGEEPLPDWELFTPYGMYLKCGPGLVWSYVPSNVPANAPAKQL